MRPVVAVVLALILISAACGGGNEADELAEAIGEVIWLESQEDLDAGTSPFPEFTEQDAGCVGEVVVDVIGYETLVEAGVTVETVEEEVDLEAIASSLDDTTTAGKALIDGMDDCVDFSGSMSAELAAEMGIGQESAGCVIDGLMSDDLFRSSLADAFFGVSSGDPLADPELVGAMFDLINECLTDEELASLMDS